MNRPLSLALRSLVLAMGLLSLLCGIPASAEPVPAAPTAGAKPLAYLRTHIGQEPYNLWKTQPLHRRLMTLLGPEYASFIGNLNPASQVEEQNGILHVEGNAPHNGGVEEAALLVDVENDTIEVFILHKETVVKAWAENNRTVVIPHDTMEVFKHWPRTALAQALAGLLQTSRSAKPTAGAANATPTAPKAPAFTPTAKLCQPDTPCDEVNSFAATVSDFRTSATDRYKIVTATLHITNKLDRPLILGLVQDSGVGTDDQGNRFVVASANNVRGIGLITSTVDPKFSLQPGESSDARVEFFLQMAHNQIYGTSWELSLTLREIDPVGASGSGQFRMGREHSLRFANLVNRLGGATPARSTAGYVPQPAALATNTAPVAVADACGPTPRCYSAGLFTATIAQMTASSVGNFHDHLLRMDIRFRNVSNQPIILAYKAASSSVIDNLGNYYYWGHAGTHDLSVQGIGMVESQKANPSFVLQPGESRNATFQVIRYRPGNAQLGTSFTYSVTIEQLEILPSQQIRTVRDFSMNIPDLRPNGFSPQGINNSIQKFGDIFKKK